MNVRDIGVVAVDTTLPDEQLCLLGCGVTSGLGAVFNLAEVEPGSSVAVVGCGHLGLWMIQAARVAGATQIIAVEPRAERRALAGELGATDLVDPADGDPVEQVQALTRGRGADCTLRFTKMLETGLIDARPIVSRRFSLDQVNEAFRAAEAREVITGIVEPSSAAPS